MQAWRFPPADGWQSAASQEEEDEEDEYQHRHPQQLQREHPLFVLLLPVSGEDFTRGRRQPAALQQHARQHTHHPGNGLWAPTSASSLWLLRRTVRRRAETNAVRVLATCRMARTNVRDGDLLFLSVPGSSLLLAHLHGRPHVSKNPSMQQEQHLNINQSVITSNSLSSFFFLSQLHTQTVSIRDLSRKESTPASNMKRADLLPLNQTDQSLSVYLSLSTPPELLKGKVVVFTPWMLSIFLSNREKKRSVTWRGSTSFLRESVFKMAEDIYMWILQTEIYLW